MNKRDRKMTMLKSSHYRRLRGERLISRGTITVLAAVFVGAVVGVAPELPNLAAKGNGRSAPVRYDAPLVGCAVTDGDTIRCGGERIRLLAIDAPEMPGQCRPRRDCAPGDPWASTSSLAGAISHSMTIDRVATDHYGRTLARVAGPHGDLSCWQLSHKQAIYKPSWDNELHIARTCPSDAL